MMRIQNFLLFVALLGCSLTLHTVVSVTDADAEKIISAPFGSSDSGGMFIGKDPETGDSVMRLTPPAPQYQQQPNIPYIVPQVNVPSWQQEPPRPPIILPPGYVPPPGIYPPGTYPPGNYPPSNYPPGNYPPSRPWSGSSQPPIR